MKTETKYICEKCGYKWNTEEECAKCEASHNDAASIVSQKYNHQYGESAKYPGSVTLQMANGHKIEYRYFKPVIEKAENNNNNNNGNNNDGNTPNS